MKQRRFEQIALFYLKENVTKTSQNPNQSSIAILILSINSIVSLPNSNISRFFHFSPYF
jgi:hypothetical protein